MGNLTLSIPDKIRREMEEFKEINWSEISREAIITKLKKLFLLRKLEKLLEKSELSEEKTMELGESVKELMWKRYKKEGW